MTICTNYITLNDFRQQPLGRVPALPRHVGQGERFSFSGPMVKVHDAGRIALAAIGTRNALGLPEHGPVALNPLLGQCSVVFLVLVVILPLVFAVALTAPGLKKAVLADPEL